MPRLGQPIFLNLQLFDGVSNKYVKAHVMDSAGVDLAGSPLNCPHLAHGLYTDESLSMPFSLQVKAVYKVYIDPGFTIPSDEHSDAIDVFDLDKIDIMANLAGQIEDGSISGKIDTTTVVSGSIEKSEADGELRY
jgi:hypothetical protein